LKSAMILTGFKSSDALAERAYFALQKADP
jgi:hypothetical protein